MDRHAATPSVDTVPGERAREWVAHHHDHAAPATYVYEFVWDVTADAVGPFVTDIDGNVFLDFASHVAANPLGYNNPKIMDRLRAVGITDPLKFAGQDFYAATGWPPDDPDVPGPTQLLDRLTAVSSHYDMDTVFLSNSGAEAVENGIKICYDYRDGAQHAITFDGAFHGRTLGALSLNRSKGVYRSDFPEITGVESVPFCRNRTCDAASCSCGFLAEQHSGALRSMVEAEGGNLYPEDVAYIIVEPIQGEGGFRFPSEAFADELADICVTYDIPLVADEIQAGLGRTGEMWASDHYAFDPDVITAAKGLGVGATISRAEVFPDETGRLSSTWGGGDILGAARGCLVLDAIHEHDLMANAVERGEQFVDHLRDAAPEFVTDVRGKGLMIGIDFDTKARRDAVHRAAFKEGLITLGCGQRTLRILPPLDVTERELRLGAETLRDAFATDRMTQGD
jgi:4-aminobutyrate aminotransferase